MKNLFQVNSSVIITNSKRQVLLAKRSLEEDVYPGLWCVPGGKLDNTDSDLEFGLKREVLEEIGIEISDIKLIENHVFSSEEKNVVYVHFSAKIISGEPKALEDTEKVIWFDFDKLPNKEDFTPNTYDLLLKFFKNSQ